MPMTSGMQAQRLERLKRRYPFVYTRELTKTAGGRSICAVQLGLGDTKVLLTGGHQSRAVLLRTGFDVLDTPYEAAEYALKKETINI